MRRLTQEEFITRSSLIHSGFFDYSKTVFKSANYHVNIICPIHGMFSQRADHHLEGRKCKLCSTNSIGNTSKKEKNKKNFLDKALFKWKEKYTYDKSTYMNARTPMKIHCPIHGEFWQSPSNHLKCQCQKCAMNILAISNTYTTDEFVLLAKRVHGETFSYDKTLHENNKKKVVITCITHGDFLQQPYNHLMGKGCKLCKLRSKNERIIEACLKKAEIEYEREKTFDTCINPSTGRKLKFDFYLPSIQTCIEFDGRQHFEPVSIWGGAIELDNTKIRDQIKNSFCVSHNMTLIRLNFKDDVIYSISCIIAEIEEMLYEQSLSNSHQCLAQ